MRRLFASLLLLVVSTKTLAAGASSTATRPNIVYILVDDLGYGDVQCLNPERGRIATPRLDRFAAQGMTFTDAHSGSSVCTPTRYGLLTGRYAWRTRLQNGVLDGGNDDPLISVDRLTVAGFLRDQGYATACIGKWHLGMRSETSLMSDRPRDLGYSGLPVGAQVRGGPTERGFDYFWGCSNARTMASIFENDRVTEILDPVELLPRLTRRTVEWLTSNTAAEAKRPFFLYVALTSPHTPILPGPEWKGKSGFGLYADFTRQTDDCVGQILDALDHLKLAEDTLVIFASDNGCAVQAGVEKLEALGHFASAQFRGYKTDIWDGGHRVPCFVRWPGRIQAGAVNRTTVGLGDFFATVAELLGQTLPPAAAPDSESFLGGLLGRREYRPRADIVHHSQQGVFALRSGNWKFILGGGSGGIGKPTDRDAAIAGLPDAQLYDLANDPAETNNLVMKRPDEARRLARRLEQYVACGRSTPGPQLTNDVAIKLPAPTALDDPKK